MPKNLQLEELNRMEVEQFTDVLGDIFEHSAWIAEEASSLQPFSSLEELHVAMMSVVHAATDEQKMGLLRAHPELAGKAARSGQLTESSTNEQKGAGLRDLSSEQMRRISELNRTYRQRFSFPFIIAVMNYTRDSIFSEFERRIENSREEEIITAITQVGDIARFRLAALFGVDPRRLE